jgi:hypothetical protein
MEDITETVNELNDASTDRAINTERDSLTTNMSQDVDTQELIRSSNAGFQSSQRMQELEGVRRDRTQADLLFNQTLNFTSQMQAIALQGMQNMVQAGEMAKNQDRRHVDHTLTDLHGSDVNPGAGPGAPTTA